MVQANRVDVLKAWALYYLLTDCGRIKGAHWVVETGPCCRLGVDIAVHPDPARSWMPSGSHTLWTGGGGRYTSESHCNAAQAVVHDSHRQAAGNALVRLSLPELAGPENDPVTL